MLDIVLTWIYEKAPLIFGALVLIVSTVFVSRKVSKYNNRIVVLETTCADVPSISTKLDTIDRNLRTLTAFLSGKHTDMQSGFVQSQSPTQLTDAGFDVLEKTGSKKYVEEHVEELIQEMEKQDFKSSLDVQEYAISIVIGLFNTDAFIHIRNYLFQNPVYRTSTGTELTLSTANIYQIVGIFIRDKYFEKHPELRNID